MEYLPYNWPIFLYSFRAAMKGIKNKRNEAVLKLAGKNIKKYRKLLNLSQTELAFKADIDYTQIWNMEAGKTNSSISHYVSVAKALGVTVGLLIGEVEEK